MVLNQAFLIFCAFPVVFIAWSAYSLAENYVKAKSTGLPITLRFVSPGSPLWMMLSPLIMRICSYLPFTSTFIATYRRGWEGRQRCRPHVEMGDMFMIVTPGGNWLKVCNDRLVSEILKRRDDFYRDLAAFEVLNIYGKNLASTGGAEWNRHRKVAAVTFTEKNNELVWRESLKQAGEMLQYWLHRSPQPIRTLAEDTRVFTLNVLAAALFDKTYPFESRAESKLRQKNGKKDSAFGYRDSLSTILRMIIPILIFGEKKLKEAWWLPESFRKAGFAVSDFRTYVTDLINEERVLISQGKQNTPNLVTNLVRACEEESDGSLSTGDSRPGRTILTKDEIISDLFVFAFAGNDTTAITLAHILGEMAAHPEIQDWISEEIHFVLQSTDIKTWNYSTCSQLKRCWAVVYETLRLCHPLGQLVKTTGNLPRTLNFDSRIITIPPHTTVEINLPALQTHPRYWGADSLTWNPKRFISGDSINHEILPPDTTEVFLPWSTGKNVCPGKRFSQVELVAALVTLFRDYRLEPVMEPRETIEDAKLRTRRLAEDVEMRLLHEIREPEKIGLRWSKKST
ncbi:cytochrome P450 [Lindgomyces ingoldianus]|uniref:Cytochrome P450 n=1 Tax=Lindgomyces ingoldianus TaxID=673940 RepID=A0ACB6QAM8_9PLEO|nr:cytochrome P450 [Lindgomyces ingoldianus]KAF2463555.1 cytochrome P450 [Lindgomyces ingoldianus]